MALLTILCFVAAAGSAVASAAPVDAADAVALPLPAAEVAAGSAWGVLESPAAPLPPGPGLPMNEERSLSPGDAAAAPRALVNTQTSWNPDFGCNGGTYAFDSGTGSCYAYSCAPYYGSARIISTAPCTCMNSNDCFYTWHSKPNNFAESQLVCSGANLQTNSFGTCVNGAAVAPIAYPVSQTPNAGCPAQKPCSSGGSCFPAKCPASSMCYANSCPCTTDSDCAGSFLASQYTPQCSSSGKCTARLTYPTLVTCTTCASTADGYWCPTSRTCYSSLASEQPFAASCGALISTASQCNAATSASDQYIVSLWGRGTAGFTPSCSNSNDAALLTSTVSLGQCFGAVRLGSSGGATASYKLVAGSGSVMELNVYGTTTCSDIPVSLGTDSGPTDAEGACHSSGFTLGTLTYQNSWTVKKAPSAAAGAVVGLIVGIIVGVLVLGCIAAAVHRHRAMKGAAFIGGGGGGTTVVVMSPMNANPIMQQQCVGARRPPFHPPPPPFFMLATLSRASHPSPHHARPPLFSLQGDAAAAANAAAAHAAPAANAALHAATGDAHACAADDARVCAAAAVDGVHRR